MEKVNINCLDDEPESFVSRVMRELYGLYFYALTGVVKDLVFIPSHYLI